MKRLVKLLQMVRRGLGGHADARMSMNTYNIRYSADPVVGARGDLIFAPWLVIVGESSAAWCGGPVCPV
jgi:hypothetical protein